MAVQYTPSANSMKAFPYICALLLAFCGGILCTSCRSSKPAPERNVSRAEGTPLTPHSVVEAFRGGLDTPAAPPPRRLFGLLPPKKVVSSPENVASDKLSGGKPRKCKGCTIVYSAGPATVTTTTVGKKATAATAEGAAATTIGKAKGPTAIGDSAAATDNTKAAQRGGAAATAAGATATATTEKNGIPWWLWVGAAAVLAYVGYRKFSTL